MNYLLFVYYNAEVENSEEKTQEIGTKLAEHMTSGQVKFMYGDRHAIFHFGCKSEYIDVSDVVFFISEEVVGFEYLLTKKGRDYSSNFDKDNLEHLMTLKNTTPKKHKPTPPKLRTKDLEGGETISILGSAEVKGTYFHPSIVSEVLAWVCEDLKKMIFSIFEDTIVQ